MVMKPYDTKHTEISGTPFPLALCDGDLNVMLFFWKLLERETESTRLLALPQMCSSLFHYVTSA